MPLNPQHRLSRRGIVRGMGVTGISLLAASLMACQPAASPTPAPGGAATAPASPPTQPASPTTPAATQAPAKPKTLQKSRVAWIADTEEFSFALMGKPQGLYEAEGIDVEFVGLADGGTQVKALLAGEVDFMIGGSASVFPAVAQGAPLRIYSSAFPRLNFVMYAKPGISSVNELEGKSVASAGQGAFLSVIANALLREKGVDLNQIQFVNVGPSTAVYQAVEAGKVDAGPSSISFIPRARAAGNPVVIADFAQELPKYLRVVVAGQERTATDNPSLVQGTINGILRSIRYGLEHKQEFVEYGVTQMSKEREQMEFLWDYDVENRIVDPNGAIDPENAEFTQQVNVEAGSQQQIVPFDRVVNLQFQRAFIQQYGEYQWK